MTSVGAVIVAKDISEVLPETIEGLKTYAFSKVIVVVAKDSEKPMWCDVLVVDKGRLGKARNTGVDLANSDFICMVDADIILTKNYVKPYLNTLKILKLPQWAENSNLTRNLFTRWLRHKFLEDIIRCIQMFHAVEQFIGQQF